MIDINQFISDGQARIEQLLDETLNTQHILSADLLAAMRHSVLGGGKRLRPLLAYATAITLGKPMECADTAACALELIHAYSLIHDDLPAMDDDDLRRGKPTCHKAFNEAAAILAGDALQALAFNLLASSAQLQVSDATRIKMIKILSYAAGPAGMVAGQMMDIHATGGLTGEAYLQFMHQHKTGALIDASVALGALSTDAVTQEQLLSLHRFAWSIGLAFQVQDDILDIESSTEILGKKQGADMARNKPTYPALLGLTGAKNKAKELAEQSLQALEPFESADLLKALAQYVIERVN